MLPNVYNEQCDPIEDMEDMFMYQSFCYTLQDRCQQQSRAHEVGQDIRFATRWNC